MFKENQNAPRPSEHPPVGGKNVKTFSVRAPCASAYAQTQTPAELPAGLCVEHFYIKKNQNAPRPSEHPPVRGGKCQNV